MKFVKWILYILLIPILLFAFFLVYSSITNYSPKEQTVEVENSNVPEISDTISLSFVTWNIGYAGLDKSMDFFYDGGENVRPKKDQSFNNLKGILATLKNFQDFDFVLLQEVDKNSKRSYGHNQLETIGHHFKDYNSSFGTNYKVKFVPIPPSDPMGKVESGVVTLSKSQAEKSIRYSFPGNYSWPMSLFMLDRCFLVNTYPLVNGKKLIVINTHNSAYDDGSLRRQQMDFMKSILLDFYDEGNYVIAGGDWNQCPYNFEPMFDGEVFDTELLAFIDKDYPKDDWKWAYDSTLPTNRRVKIPYEKGKTQVTLIDFFLVSPNVIIEEVKGMNLGFEFTDHQPVELKVKLIN